jgi:hypothetical protein
MQPPSWGHFGFSTSLDLPLARATGRTAIHRAPIHQHPFHCATSSDARERDMTELELAYLMNHTAWELATFHAAGYRTTALTHLILVDYLISQSHNTYVDKFSSAAALLWKLTKRGSWRPDAAQWLLRANIVAAGMRGWPQCAVSY